MIRLSLKEILDRLLKQFLNHYEIIEVSSSFDFVLLNHLDQLRLKIQEYERTINRIDL